MFKSRSALLGLLLTAGAATVLPAEEQQVAPIPDLHERPIVEKDGRSLLWAAEDAEGNVEWFDMTGATIDPHRFQFGIGKDTIASIDAPEFVPVDDPRLVERGINLDTPVLGVKIEGIAFTGEHAHRGDVVVLKSG